METILPGESKNLQTPGTQKAMSEWDPEAVAHMSSLSETLQRSKSLFGSREFKSKEWSRGAKSLHLGHPMSRGYGRGTSQYVGLGGPHRPPPNQRRDSESDFMNVKWTSRLSSEMMWVCCEI